VDDQDGEFPISINRIAPYLRVRIQESKQLIVLASENSKNSIWVPWELGVKDNSTQMPEDIAIFPVSNSSPLFVAFVRFSKKLNTDFSKEGFRDFLDAWCEPWIELDGSQSIFFLSKSFLKSGF
jgi:MTH538 TIR-like domain (DUF1863)